MANKTKTTRLEPDFYDNVPGYKGFRHNLKTANDLSFQLLEVEDPRCRFTAPLPGCSGIHFSVNPMAAFAMYPPLSADPFDKQPRYTQVTGDVVKKKTQISGIPPCYACAKLTRSNTTMNIVDYTEHIIRRVRKRGGGLREMGLDTHSETYHYNTGAKKESTALIVSNEPDNYSATTEGAYSLCVIEPSVRYYAKYAVTLGACSIAAMLNKPSYDGDSMALAFGINSVAYCSVTNGFAYSGGDMSVAITKCIRNIAVANGYGAVYLYGDDNFGVTHYAAKVTGQYGIVVLAEQRGAVYCRKWTEVIFQMPNGEWERLVCGCGKFEPYVLYSWRQLVRMVNPKARFRKVSK